MRTTDKEAFCVAHTPSRAAGASASGESAAAVGMGRMPPHPPTPLRMSPARRHRDLAAERAPGCGPRQC